MDVDKLAKRQGMLYRECLTVLTGQSSSEAHERLTQQFPELMVAAAVLALAGRIDEFDSTFSSEIHRAGEGV